ncbi:MAG: hypothetical protein HFACDABA_01260 [Anaerolineales bacterium]|nr:hypothetical protein [Anaerolineales bacterium]
MNASSAPLPKQKIRLRARLGNWLLGTNAILLFGFLYLPVVILVVFSFNATRSIAVLSGFSTEWYAALAANTELLDAARNSLLVGLIATIVSTIVGTLTALAMDRYHFRFRTAFDANLYLPIVIPEIVMGISLLLFFNQALFPFLNSVFGMHATTGLHTITLAHIAFDIPFVYVIVRARLADFDRSLEEAAADLGADEWQTFKRVTLPLLMPGIIGGALMAFTLSLDDYLITAFTKGVREQTMPLYIYSLVRRGITPEINALSTALLAGSIGLVALSQTAQSGGVVYTRAMSLGAWLGFGAFGLLGLPGVFAAFSVGAFLLHTLMLAGFYFAWRTVSPLREELHDTGRFAALLVGITVLVSTVAVYFSCYLLLL